MPRSKTSTRRERSFHTSSEAKRNSSIEHMVIKSDPDAHPVTALDIITADANTASPKGTTVEDPILLEEYEVEAILGIRDLKAVHGPRFKVKWRGYDDSQNTWEPLENLDNCQDLVKEFLLDMYTGHQTMKTGVPAAKIRSVDPNSRLTRSSSSSVSPSPSMSRSSRSSETKSSAPATVPSTPSRNIPIIRTLKQIKDDRPPQPVPTKFQEFENIFQGSAGPKISVENTVDDAACPPGFQYTNDFVYGEGVQPPDPNFSSKCDCGPGQCTLKNKCPCMIEAVAENSFDCLPFERDGRVSVNADKILYECHAECGCGPDCISKASQQGRKFAMKIKRYPVKGWGVLLDQEDPIPPRTFVARYTGEIITNQEAEKRGQIYDKEGATWLFDLDYMTGKEVKYSIDASKYGNESHFFNHSCDPNLSVHILMGGDTAGDLAMMTLSFWSNRWIRRGDELTFDYNGKYVQPWLRQDSQDEADFEETNITEGMVPCMCGATRCRKWVHL
ncbi:hypothetical protein EDD11_008749 [Mortierella claussenii]|nr:hypothetical protein EDD11_008749 [Mortierella claussenii]